MSQVSVKSRKLTKIYVLLTFSFLYNENYSQTRRQNPNWSFQFVSVLPSTYVSMFQRFNVQQISDLIFFVKSWLVCVYPAASEDVDRNLKKWNLKKIFETIFCFCLCQCMRDIIYSKIPSSEYFYSFLSFYFYFISIRIYIVPFLSLCLSV
jgi:hypothetical protein